MTFDFLPAQRDNGSFISFLPVPAIPFSAYPDSDEMTRGDFSTVSKRLPLFAGKRPEQLRVPYLNAPQVKNDWVHTESGFSLPTIC
ncbi:hypothetical protein KCP69_03580 [Salmonella enterica subsp. enterica]|nr:hypothetical protein KCP69_03580 [Salmonella enterica subsp. enterica]